MLEEPRGTVLTQVPSASLVHEPFHAIVWRSLQFVIGNAVSLVYYGEVLVDQLLQGSHKDGNTAVLRYSSASLSTTSSNEARSFEISSTRLRVESILLLTCRATYPPFPPPFFFSPHSCDRVRYRIQAQEATNASVKICSRGKDQLPIGIVFIVDVRTPCQSLRSPCLSCWPACSHIVHAVQDSPSISMKLFIERAPLASRDRPTFMPSFQRQRALQVPLGLSR